MTRFKRIFILAPALILFSLATSTTVDAEDFGNWQIGCAGGFVCFYEVGAGGVANAATTRDSKFANNLLYANNHGMDNNVNTIWNRFVGNISVQAFTGNTYVGPTGFCLPPGQSESPLSGVSSYKAC